MKVIARILPLIVTLSCASFVCKAQRYCHNQLSKVGRESMLTNLSITPDKKYVIDCIITLNGGFHDTQLLFPISRGKYIPREGVLIEEGTNLKFKVTIVPQKKELKISGPYDYLNNMVLVEDTIWGIDSSVYEVLAYKRKKGKLLSSNVIIPRSYLVRKFDSGVNILDLKEDGSFRLNFSGLPLYTGQWGNIGNRIYLKNEALKIAVVGFIVSNKKIVFDLLPGRVKWVDFWVTELIWKKTSTQ